jgi:hypothetical protein
VGGISLWALGIKKRGRGDENKRIRVHNGAGRMKEKALESASWHRVGRGTWSVCQPVSEPSTQSHLSGLGAIYMVGVCSLPSSNLPQTKHLIVPMNQVSSRMKPGKSFREITDLLEQHLAKAGSSS